MAAIAVCHSVGFRNLSSGNFYGIWCDKPVKLGLMRGFRQGVSDKNSFLRKPFAERRKHFSGKNPFFFTAFLKSRRERDKNPLKQYFHRTTEIKIVNLWNLWGFFRFLFDCAVNVCVGWCEEMKDKFQNHNPIILFSLCFFFFFMLYRQGKLLFCNNSHLYVFFHRKKSDAFLSLCGGARGWWSLFALNRW